MADEKQVQEFPGDLPARFRQLDIERDALLNERKAIRGKLIELRTEREALRGKIKTLRDERKALRGKLNTLRDERKALRDNRDALSVERTTLAPVSGATAAKEGVPIAIATEAVPIDAAAGAEPVDAAEEDAPVAQNPETASASPERAVPLRVTRPPIDSVERARINSVIATVRGKKLNYGHLSVFMPLLLEHAEAEQAPAFTDELIAAVLVSDKFASALGGGGRGSGGGARGRQLARGRRHRQPARRRQVVVVRILDNGDDEGDADDYERGDGSSRGGSSGGGKKCGRFCIPCSNGAICLPNGSHAYNHGVQDGNEDD